jgi:hypothetical protein
MTDGLNREPRIGEPETPFEAGIQGVRSQPKTVLRFLAGEGMADTSISGPVMLQQPPRWSHDFDETGQTRATLRSVIPVYENPPQVPTPPEGSSDTTTATTEFVDRAMQQAVLEAVRKARIGVTDGYNAAPGEIGEYLALINPAPGQEILAGNPSAIMNMEIPAGDWDLQAVNGFGWQGVQPAPVISYAAALSTVNNFPGFGIGTATLNESPILDVVLPTFYRLNVSVPTTMFLMAYANFSVGRVFAYGAITARRRR